MEGHSLTRAWPTKKPNKLQSPTRCSLWTETLFPSYNPHSPTVSPSIRLLTIKPHQTLSLPLQNPTNSSPISPFILSKMEQPLAPNSSPPKETTSSNNKKRRPPSPEEVLAHYESQGLDSKHASLKAISDLQTLLFRSAASARGGNKDQRLTADAARKLDTVNTRLAILEMKLDSKPGFPESIAIGVTSGAILHAIGSAAPHVARIWDAVKSATATKDSSH